MCARVDSRASLRARLWRSGFLKLLYFSWSRRMEKRLVMTSHQPLHPGPSLLIALDTISCPQGGCVPEFSRLSDRLHSHSPLPSPLGPERCVGVDWGQASENAMQSVSGMPCACVETTGAPNGGKYVDITHVCICRYLSFLLLIRSDSRKSRKRIHGFKPQHGAAQTTHIRSSTLPANVATAVEALARHEVTGARLLWATTKARRDAESRGLVLKTRQNVADSLTKATGISVGRLVKTMDADEFALPIRAPSSPPQDLRDDNFASSEGRDEAGAISHKIVMATLAKCAPDCLGGWGEVRPSRRHTTTTAQWIAGYLSAHANHPQSIKPHNELGDKITTCADTLQPGGPRDFKMGREDDGRFCLPQGPSALFIFSATSSCFCAPDPDQEALRILRSLFRRLVWNSTAALRNATHPRVIRASIPFHQHKPNTHTLAAANRDPSFLFIRVEPSVTSRFNQMAVELSF
ncbi:unnamed protein product [Mesocestoides corti]|uniref:Uncharacterized protein n=1 Tax=Mesocestoides corti TaxID=53468 RepID=A0A0R3UH48_MESCO|nr:unnamed protein product [Mesocestoides corti]